jgi:hypothetical protein
VRISNIIVALLSLHRAGRIGRRRPFVYRFAGKMGSVVLKTHENGVDKL